MSSPQRWLEVNGLQHWVEFYTDYGLALQKRFLGHFLKGEDTGWQDQPPVHLRVPLPPLPQQATALPRKLRVRWLATGPTPTPAGRLVWLRKPAHAHRPRGVPRRRRPCPEKGDAAPERLD